MIPRLAVPLRVLSRALPLLAAIGLAAMIATATAARAGSFADAVALFAAGSFSDSADAVSQIETSGNPLALPIVNALHDGRLYADEASKTVVIKQPDGKVIKHWKKVAKAETHPAAVLEELIAYEAKK